MSDSEGIYYSHWIAKYIYVFKKWVYCIYVAERQEMDELKNGKKPEVNYIEINNTL